MLLTELNQWIRDYLQIDTLRLKDIAINGLQVERQNQEIKKIAFAVDACQESFERAVQAGADLLFVHHGLFWGHPLAITGRHYRRIQYLVEKDLALYAVHLPLDVHPEVGNNAAICQVLGLEELRPFGEYKGAPIGYQGRLPQPEGINSLVERLFGGYENTIKVLPFGPEKIETIGIVSGGGGMAALEALEKDLDLYITGDASHTLFHDCQEGAMNVIFGGHYATETWGVKFLEEKISRDLGLETLFIDIPTGL